MFQKKLSSTSRVVPKKLPQGQGFSQSALIFAKNEGGLSDKYLFEDKLHCAKKPKGPFVPSYLKTIIKCQKKTECQGVFAFILTRKLRIWCVFQGKQNIETENNRTSGSSLVKFNLFRCILYINGAFLPPA